MLFRSNVVTLHGSNELVHFVSNAYNKVKAVWKKSPNDYTVFLQNGDYKLVSNDNLTRRERCEYCDGSGSIPEGDYGEGWEDSCECPECDGDGRYVATITIAHGEKIDKFGRTRPEVIKWVDPRTGEQVIMREDGTLTPQGKRLRAMMQTFKVNNTNQWQVWIDREFVSLNDSVAHNPWDLTK